LRSPTSRPFYQFHPRKMPEKAYYYVRNCHAAAASGL
jgi:hypothetical protein